MMMAVKGGQKGSKHLLRRYLDPLGYNGWWFLNKNKKQHEAPSFFPEGVCFWLVIFWLVSIFWLFLVVRHGVVGHGVSVITWLLKENQKQHEAFRTYRE